MITLVLVDVDNLIEDFRLPRPAAIASEVRAALVSPARKDEARTVVVMVGLNVAIAQGVVTWRAMTDLAHALALVVEGELGRQPPARVEIEPVLMPSLPESVDGALARLVTHASSAETAGRVGDVVLVSQDRGLHRQVRRSLPGYAENESGRVRWWRLTRRFDRVAPAVSTAASVEPETHPTGVIETAGHAAWAATQPAQTRSSEAKGIGTNLLKDLATDILIDPWLRTQLSVTRTSVTGPARLRTALTGERAPLVVGADETVDYQQTAPSIGQRPRCEVVGPGTLRARWEPSGAQVLRTGLPLALVDAARSVVAAPSLVRQSDNAAIDDLELLDVLEGSSLTDPSWTLVFRKAKGFHCELSFTEMWPPVWWNKTMRKKGVTTKVVGVIASTPRKIADVPFRLHVARRRLRLRSVAERGIVTLPRAGRRGELVKADSPNGTCVVLCASDIPEGDVECAPVHETDPAELAVRLGQDAGELERQGVRSLPLLIPMSERLPGLRPVGRGR